MVPTGASPKNQCPVCYIQDVSLTHPGWNGAYRNSSYKPMPSMLSTGCFSYTSRLKWCLRWKSPRKPCPVLSLQDVSLIQAESLPTANISHKTMPRSLWDVSFTHPGSNGAYRNSSHKPVPRMLSTGCFSYTSRLKWCLQELLRQTCAQYAIYRMFLTNPGWNGAYRNSSQKPVPSMLYIGCFSYTSRLK